MLWKCKASWLNQEKASNGFLVKKKTKQNKNKNISKKIVGCISQQKIKCTWPYDQSECTNIVIGAQ